MERRPASDWMPSLVLGACLGGLGVWAARRLFTPQPPPLASVGKPLDALNAAFHAAYDANRTDAALDAPVLVVLADQLHFFRRDERTCFEFAPPVFHAIKSVAHGPVALYANLHRLGDRALDASGLKLLEQLGERIAAAEASLPSQVEPANGLANLQQILALSRAFVSQRMSEGRVHPGALLAFARALGPLLLKATDDATRVQLDALHRHVLALLELMTVEERRHFQVVVTGEHQARARSLAMQYFAKLLGTSEAKRRLTYGEGLKTEAEALALVGTRRLDFAVATAFFADPARLQQDVLGDAAQSQLERFPLPSLLEGA